MGRKGTESGWSEVDSLWLSVDWDRLSTSLARPATGVSLRVCRTRGGLGATTQVKYCLWTLSVLRGRAVSPRPRSLRLRP